MARAVRNKSRDFKAVQLTSWGIMWTKRGFRVYKPTDWILTAPTGCTWPVSNKHLEEFYEPSLTDI